MSSPRHHLLDDLLTEAARLRRMALVSAERVGDARCLVFSGTEHVAVRRWLEREQDHTALLRFSLSRDASGQVRVWVSPAPGASSAGELLTELSGD